MRIPQLGLAALCLILGLVPILAVHTFPAAWDSSQHGFGLVLAQSSPLLGSLGSGLRTPNGEALFMPLALLVLLLLLLSATFAALRFLPGTARLSPPWLCGYVQATDEHRYTAHHLYRELKRMVHPSKPGGPPPPPHVDP